MLFRRRRSIHFTATTSPLSYVHKTLPSQEFHFAIHYNISLSCILCIQWRRYQSQVFLLAQCHPAGERSFAKNRAAQLNQSWVVRKEMTLVRWDERTRAPPMTILPENQSNLRGGVSDVTRVTSLLFSAPNNDNGLLLGRWRTWATWNGKEVALLRKRQR